MKKSSCIILLLLGFYAGLFAQMQIDKVIGVVGNKIILQSDIEAQVKIMQSQSQGLDLPQDIRCLILDQLFANALLLAEADKASQRLTNWCDSNGRKAS